MIKLFSMFSRYGGSEFSLQKAGIEYEVVGFSEIDKYAIQIYEQNHGKVKNFGDATKINPEEIPDFDLLTGGFPCQAFSSAGKQLGENDARGTLFYEIVRIAKVKQPKYMLLENVQGLTQEKFEETFKKIIYNLRIIGYNVYYKVLNSKDYGIPQSRARIWFVCIRKDIDAPFKFQFPASEKLKLSIKDILETDVDKKYYLSEKKVNNMIKVLNNESVRYGDKSSLVLHEFANTITKTDSPIILLENNIRFKEEFIRQYKNVSKTLIARANEVPILKKEYSFRRLTPRECFRLMGFLNDEINISNISDSQLYKLAGNGWCLRPASDILKRLFK